MADEQIRKRERSLKGAARAKLSRTKEFDHSKWVGGGMLDYRFSNARRIVNDIYAGEVSASRSSEYVVPTALSNLYPSGGIKIPL